MKKGLKWIGAIFGILLIALLASQKAEALSYPSIYPDYEMAGATLNRGDTASFGFTVYRGSYQNERYYAKVYYKDDNGYTRQVAYASDTLSSSITNLTLTWDTGDYDPGLYTIEVWTEYYVSGSGWVEAPQQRKTFTVTVIGAYASGTAGTNITWVLNHEHVLTFTGSGNMTAYSFGDAPWGDWKTKSLVHSIVVGEGITSIGSSAFYNCENLKKVSLPKSLKLIGDDAFYNCTNLESIAIPDNVVTIGNWCFNGCTSLRDIKLPASLTAVNSWSFQDCGSLESIYLPAKVQKINSSAFSGCALLEKIWIPAALKEISYSAFRDCYSLAQVYVYGGTFAGNVSSSGNDYFLNASRKNVNPGWKAAGSNWQYERLDGTMARNSWEQINGKWYHFDENGYMQTGWQKISGKYYYLGTNGVMATGWQTLSGKTYYLGTNGVMATGWQKVSGKWYYFNTSGAMQTGWQQISGKYYYLGTDGVMQTDWLKISGKYYYLGTDGVMATGWKKVSDKWYYFSTGGVMQTGWQKISGKYYYLGDNGAMRTEWQQISGKYYYLGPTGVMQTGWQQINGYWYYLGTNGVMATGWKTIDGKTYYFKDSGVMATKEWVKGYWLNSDGTWTYTYVGSWKKDAKGWRYGDTSGHFEKNKTVRIDNVYYTFDADGYMVD